MNPKPSRPKPLRNDWSAGLRPGALPRLLKCADAKPLAAAIAFALCIFTVPARAQTNPPTEWIDPDTGHRVIQLSTEPGSESIYFNLNPFTPDGKKMVITTSNGIAMVNLETRAVEKLVTGRVHIIMVGHKTGKIYFGEMKMENGQTNRLVCSIDPNTKAVAEILKLPRGQQVDTVNADETLLAGT